MAQTSPVKSPAPTVTVEVRQAANVGRATGAAREFAFGLGFSQLEADQLALVAAELASNLVRHAGGGSLTFGSLAQAERPGMQIESADHGPGIADVELAMTDGYSTAGGLGNGLGTVNRFMDELEFHQQAPAGLRIVCRRWTRPARSLSVRRLACGAATRACRRAAENGDALVVRQWEEHALLGVVDGLGHGPMARQAAQAARQYLEEHFDQPLPNLFRGVDRTCRATRGVVLGLGRFDLHRQTVTLASIGNVEIRLLGGPAPIRPVARRGILGFHAPEPIIAEHPWPAAGLLVMHSDGVEARWHWSEFAPLAQSSPALIARQLLLRLGKPEDDATVMVARNAQPC